MALNVSAGIWCKCIVLPELPLKPELPELPPLEPFPVPATLYGSSSGIGILGRFLISKGRWTAERNTCVKYFDFGEF